MPSAPSAISLRSVSRSLSQRRFWYGRDDPADLCGVVDQVLRVGGGQRERLVHHHVQAEVECLVGEPAWVAVGVVIVTPSNTQRGQVRQRRHRRGAGQIGPHLSLPLRGRRSPPRPAPTRSRSVISGWWKVRPPAPYPASAQRNDLPSSVAHPTILSVRRPTSQNGGLSDPTPSM